MTLHRLLGCQAVLETMLCVCMAQGRQERLGQLSITGVDMMLSISHSQPDCMDQNPSPDSRSCPNLNPHPNPESDFDLETYFHHMPQNVGSFLQSTQSLCIRFREKHSTLIHAGQIKLAVKVFL